MRKNRRFSTTRRLTLRPIGLAILVASWSGVSIGAEEGAPSESPFKLGGYARGWVSMNLQNPPETAADDKWDVSMLRGSLLLDADWKPISSLRFKAIGRLDREYKTNYLKRLEEAPAAFPGNGSVKDVFQTNAGGGIGGVMSNYNQGEIREVWAEADIGSRVKVKLGKQQVVWGETDFFRALDLVHGFDYRWRSFLEVENEELRKPLIMARVMIQVPEAKGSIDAFVRPGWDRDRDIGNTYDIAGGRWASQPARGGSFFYATDYNFRSKGADARDVTGGIRWQGIVGSVNYSIAALRTFNNDPVTNPCAATLSALNSAVTSGPAANPASYSEFRQTPKTCGFTGPLPFPTSIPLQYGDWIFPKTSILGFTASTYSSTVDAVFSTEIVYQKDRSFNFGLNGGKFGVNLTPGAFGIIQKNTLTTMFRMDKQVDLTKVIGTSRPSFGSIQFFNTRIQGFSKNDEIVQLAYWQRPRARNSALLTGILGMNYSNDRINPSLAAGWDVTYGGGFVIPAIEWVVGDNWRIKAELDLFFYGGNEKQRYLNPATFQLEEQGRGASLFGYFAHNNQAVIRVTRQF